MVVKERGNGVGAIGLAGQQKTGGVHQAGQIGRVRRRGPVRRPDNLRHDKSDVGGLVEHVGLGVDAVLGLHARKARVGKKRRHDDVTGRDPGHEQGAIGVRVHVETVGEHDHRVRPVPIGGSCPGRHAPGPGSEGRVQDLDLHCPSGPARALVEVLRRAVLLGPGRDRHPDAEGGGPSVRNPDVAREARSGGASGSPGTTYARLRRLRGGVGDPGRRRAGRQEPGSHQDYESPARLSRVAPGRAVPPGCLGLHGWQIYRRSALVRTAPRHEPA